MMDDKPTGKPWISKVEACRRLGIGRRAIDGLLAEGKLTHRGVPGSTVRVLASDVDRLAEMCTIVSGQPVRS